MKYLQSHDTTRHSFNYWFRVAGCPLLSNNKPAVVTQWPESNGSQFEPSNVGTEDKDESKRLLNISRHKFFLSHCCLLSSCKFALRVHDDILWMGLQFVIAFMYRLWQSWDVSVILRAHVLRRKELERRLSHTPNYRSERYMRQSIKCDVGNKF